MRRLLTFARFQLDLDAHRLTQGSRNIHLRPKAWQVLCYLAQRPDRLVSIDELLEAAWPETIVVPKALTNVIRELREALQDDAAAPRIIETVHRRGYRFVADVTGGMQELPLPARRAASETDLHGPALVGRGSELARLGTLWRKARDGRRQIAFVSGEPGIGKTALIDQFAAELTHAHGKEFLLGRGGCVERYGPEEPYLPILQALEDLVAGPGAALVTDCLRQYAPNWLAQLPWLLDEHERHIALPPALTAARMMQEGAAALERLTSEAPLLLVLEDLHWSDSATLDFLAFVAQRRQPARSLILAAYRPVDALVLDHPVLRTARDLRHRGLAAELPLAPLAPSAMRQYLEERLRNARLAAELVPVLEEVSGGNPLYMQLAIEHFRTRGWIEDASDGARLKAPLQRLRDEVPADVGALIGAQLEELPAAATLLLEAAAVLGEDFSPADLAACADTGPAEAEAICRMLVGRGQFLRRARHARHDAAHNERYEFVHVLHERAIYERLATSHRRVLHRRAGERIEQMAERLPDAAGRAAFHFRQAADRERAADNLLAAASASLRRSAYRETAQYLRNAIAELTVLPETPERLTREARAHLMLANVIHTRSFLHAEAREALESALRLFTRLDQPHEIFRCRMAICISRIIAGDHSEAHALAEQLLAMARERLPTLRCAAHAYAGITCFLAGRTAAAGEHLETAAQLEPEPGIPVLIDLRALVEAHLGMVLVPLGQLERSRRLIDSALTRSAAATPLERVQIATLAALTAALRHDAGAAAALAEQALAVDAQYEFPSFGPIARAVLGWARAGKRATRERVEEMCAAIAERRGLGERSAEPLLLALLAEIHLKRHAYGEAATCLQDAFAHLQDTGGTLAEAELHRLQGELLLAQEEANLPGEAAQRAEHHLRRAFELAAARSELLWKLRASSSLARLLCRQHRDVEACDLLSAVVKELPHASTAPDLQEAEALLRELRSPRSTATRSRN